MGEAVVISPIDSSIASMIKIGIKITARIKSIRLHANETIPFNKTGITFAVPLSPAVLIKLILKPSSASETKYCLEDITFNSSDFFKIISVYVSLP